MRVCAPCRLGERFRCEKPFLPSVAMLTGLNFFYWNNGGHGTTLCGKRNLESEQEHTSFFDPDDAVEGHVIAFELPDDMIRPGYPLRELGLDTDAVGRLQGVMLRNTPLGYAWEYVIYYGKDYGGPRKCVRTEVLDKLFAPVLPRRRVDVDLKEYLL